MTKYKWSFLGLIVSIILFLLFLINPLTNFINSIKIIPAEELPETIAIELASTNPFLGFIYGIDKEKLIKIGIEDKKKFEEMANKDYEEWYRNVPKKLDWSGLDVFGKSFYNWNLFWVPIIIFSVLMANYKKEPGK